MLLLYPVHSYVTYVLPLNTRSTLRRIYYVKGSHACALRAEQATRASHSRRVTVARGNGHRHVLLGMRSKQSGCVFFLGLQAIIIPKLTKPLMVRTCYGIYSKHKFKLRKKSKRQPAKDPRYWPFFGQSGL